MIQTTQIWELSLHLVDPGNRSKLSKKYGSKRSGTIYIVANGVGEAQGIAKELFESNGITPPNTIHVVRTHLVRQALQMIY